MRKPAVGVRGFWELRSHLQNRDRTRAGRAWPSLSAVVRAATGPLPSAWAAPPTLARTVGSGGQGQAGRREREALLAPD